jgi:hypothetical protein
VSMEWSSDSAQACLKPCSIDAQILVNILQP